MVDLDGEAGAEFTLEGDIGGPNWLRGSFALGVTGMAGMFVSHGDLAGWTADESQRMRVVLRAYAHLDAEVPIVAPPASYYA